MKVKAKFGTGKFEVITKKWTTTPVDCKETVFVRVQDGDWRGNGMGTPGEDLSYEQEDFQDESSNESNAHLFLNGIYCFEREGRMLFKNISIDVEPSIGHVSSWLCGEAEITVEDGVVNDLDSSPEYGIDVVRNIMIKFGYDFCDIANLKEQYEDYFASGKISVSFNEWLTSLYEYDIMDPDLLEEPEFDGPHWWYGSFLYDEVREWIYEGVTKWKQTQFACLQSGGML